jgi:hypothetical protein
METIIRAIFIKVTPEKKSPMQNVWVSRNIDAKEKMVPR